MAVRRHEEYVDESAPDEDETVERLLPVVLTDLVHELVRKLVDLRLVEGDGARNVVWRVCTFSGRVLCGGPVSGRVRGRDEFDEEMPKRALALKLSLQGGHGVIIVVGLEALVPCRLLELVVRDLGGSLIDESDLIWVNSNDAAILLEQSVDGEC